MFLDKAMIMEFVRGVRGSRFDSFWLDK
jgi:hypothetical protein